MYVCRKKCGWDKCTCACTCTCIHKHMNCVLMERRQTQRKIQHTTVNQEPSYSFIHLYFFLPIAGLSSHMHCACDTRTCIRPVSHAHMHKINNHTHSTQLHDCTCIFAGLQSWHSQPNSHTSWKIPLCPGCIYDCHCVYCPKVLQ